VPLLLLLLDCQCQPRMQRQPHTSAPVKHAAPALAQWSGGGGRACSLLG
jgi:hypothetical protein